MNLYCDQWSELNFGIHYLLHKQTVATAKDVAAGSISQNQGLRHTKWLSYSFLLIIESISHRYKVSLDKATDIYYNSLTSLLIEEGVADLHCRSEKYLAQCVWDEYQETEMVKK